MVYIIRLKFTVYKKYKSGVMNFSVIFDFFV